MGMKVLTLYLVKDENAFIKGNYESVKNQQGVEQDIFVISAKPITHVKRNIIVPVPQSLPLPVRIGISINTALRYLRCIDKDYLYRYSYIFKVDGDVKLPQDYLTNLIMKRAPVAGRGPALLISVDFFIKHLLGRYPISYCDDGYISALSISLGYWPPEYNGKGYLMIPLHTSSPEREYLYGSEYYKWGLPLELLLLMIIVDFLRGRNLIRRMFNLAGYISSTLRRETKYYWWKDYARIRTLHFASKALKLTKLK